MQFQGLLVDFDGTIHTQNQYVSPRVTAAIQGLTARGIKVGICTGRHFGFIQQYVQSAGLDDVHVVCGGAQLIGADGGVVQETVIPADVVRHIAEKIEVWCGTLIIKQTAMLYGNGRACEEIAGKNNGASALLRPLTELVDWHAPSVYLRDIPDDAWQELETYPQMTLCKQRLRSGAPGYFADGTAPGVSKQQGAAWWCAHHGLDPQHVLGIGDGENDLGLFAAVGRRLAMGNAVPALKAQADAVIPSVAADGVAWAIDHYFKD